MSEHKKIPVILDGDPGHDDAIAWVLARASRELGILAVTSCCGNQTIEKTTYNALRVCTLIGLHAPVGKGCPHPLLNDVMNAPSVHGEAGLDGPALPEPAFEASALSAPELMAKVLRESPEPVTIVATVFVLSALNSGSPFTVIYRHKIIVDVIHQHFTVDFSTGSNFADNFALHYTLLIAGFCRLLAKCNLIYLIQ